MIIYLLKTIVCSVIFLGVYLLLLEKEKMHRFNRFYLLASIVISFVIPVINIKTKAAIMPIKAVDDLIKIQENPAYISHQTIAPSTINNYLPEILIAIYAVITAFLLFRFVKNLIVIYSKVTKNKTVLYSGVTLVLTEENIVPNSFLRNIFLNKTAFKNENIDKEILQHELTHVEEKHSLDVLFIEILLVFIWFNPVFYFYKKAIKLNHEFLADDAVINIFNDVSTYQYLLLAAANQPKTFLPTSQFNFLITKKRLIMMTKQTSTTIAVVKKMALLPIVVSTVIVFCTKTIAQIPSKVKNDTAKQTAVVYGSGATQQELYEYDSTLKSILVKRTLKSGRQIEGINMSKCDRHRMAFLYKLMSDEQSKPRKWSGVLFVGLTPPIKKTPSVDQMKLWQEAKKYGIWVDGKRIFNSNLSNFKANDFVFYWESKLAENAINYGKHYFQVDLYTSAYYDQAFLKKND